MPSCAGKLVGRAGGSVRLTSTGKRRNCVKHDWARAAGIPATPTPPARASGSSSPSHDSIHVVVAVPQHAPRARSRMLHLHHTRSVVSLTRCLALAAATSLDRMRRARCVWPGPIAFRWHLWLLGGEQPPNLILCIICYDSSRYYCSIHYYNLAFYRVLNNLRRAFSFGHSTKNPSSVYTTVRSPVLHCIQSLLPAFYLSPGLHNIMLILSDGGCRAHATREKVHAVLLVVVHKQVNGGAVTDRQTDTATKQPCI
jgi:hypothetical protein